MTNNSNFRMGQLCETVITVVLGAGSLSVLASMVASAAGLA
jgi:hypothetical protein